MASFQMRQRDPLLDQGTQAMLERRGRELIGIALVIAALLLALMLGSYSPNDPGWMVSTQEPAQNILGRFGAAVSSTLIILIGQGAWSVPLILGVWGGRFILHRGAERVLGRIFFAVLAVAAASAWASTLSVPQGWPHSFGYGGLFGDTVVGALMGIVPGSDGFSLRVVSALAFFGVIAAILFVTGFSRAELQAIRVALLQGSVLLYSMLLQVMGKGASNAMERARHMAGDMVERRRLGREVNARQPAAQHPDYDAPQPMANRTALVRRAAAPAAAPGMARAEPQLIAEYEPQPLNAGAAWNAPSTLRAPPRQPEPAPEMVREKPGFLARMRRMVDPEPELIEPPLAAGIDETEAPGDDRIRARISDAIRARARGAGVAAAAPAVAMTPLQAAIAARRAEPPVLRPRRPTPLIADTRPLTTAQMRQSLHAEPPLTAAQALAQADQMQDAEALDWDSNADHLLMSDQAMAEHDSYTDDQAWSHDGYDDRFDAEADDRALDQQADRPAALQQPQARALYGSEPAIEEDWSQDWQPGDDYEPDYDPAPVVPVAAPRIAPVLDRRPIVQPAVKKPMQQSVRAQAEAQPSLRFEEAHSDFELPPLSLLSAPSGSAGQQLSDEALEENARMLESVLDDYGVKGEIVSVRPGPVVTMYELEPAPGLKASRVIGLADDIARSMSALSARVSTVPGRSVIGIELPNAHREKVVLREIIASREFGDGQQRLPLALGKDIGGTPVVANLAKMPHLLIAGTTGSGKSVAINTMILSLLYKLTPEECRLIMIDPKMLELSVYDGIPHLLSPVVTDPKKAVVALKWVVGEMEERYRKMSKMGVRNIEGYNGRVREALSKGEMFKRTIQTGFDDETGDPVFETEEFAPQPFPFIVVIVDEMADLMMVAGKEIEACIQRLAQMARASGIHLIMATQRPSVDVITGTIKANFPTRISFQVTSKIDSRTILGEMGAEQLLGQGDMLYMGNGQRIARIHGPFVSDEEVEEIVNHLKSFGPPSYMSGVVEGPDEDNTADIDQVLGLGGNTDGEDALYDQAVAIVARDRKCSTSYIQRKLGIGYNKAARLVEQMEEEGVVTPANHVGKREILIPET
ncbi:DNA translocase FtsK [Xinfangfangia sp. D13-10-4-6]|uniref:DNA translocase FtsK n=1 Tax=Pseudogemmobacter hezensis TaxID=2737662 RepID=UPI0015530A96|nr:DNA translocase FtsK [Pseudogemmobacter hezensis]NPD14428.1 DNA translocase FtsK [Pseudogemmobacter hezensis]